MPEYVTSTDWDGNTYIVDKKDLVWRPAAYGIVVKDDCILLTKQRKKFHLPGGGVELGEMPDEAAMREIKEETGIIVNNPQLVGCISGFFTWNDRKRKKIYHYHSVLLYYRCDFTGGNLSTDGFEEGEREFGEMAEWILLDQIDDIKAGSTIDWRAVVKKELQL